MSDSVVETNIPVRRMPFAAGTVPPNVPYIEGDNVGDGTKPVFVSNRKIVPSAETVGSTRRSIFLSGGTITQGTVIQTITPEVGITGTKIATIQGEGAPVDLVAPGSMTTTNVSVLKLPLLTPLWFDHDPSDTTMWIPALSYAPFNGSVNELTEQSWLTYTYSSTEATALRSKFYEKIWTHLVADWENVDSAIYYDDYTLENGTQIRIKFKRAPDGHKLVNFEDTSFAQINGSNASSVSNAIWQLYNDKTIGTAWYIMISATNINQHKFVLPITRYGFHGVGSLVKRVYPENNDNVNMRLYFCTGMTSEDTIENVHNVTVTPIDTGFQGTEVRPVCRIDVDNVSKTILAPCPILEDFVFVDMNNNQVVKRICLATYIPNN